MHTEVMIHPKDIDPARPAEATTLIDGFTRLVIPGALTVCLPDATAKIIAQAIVVRFNADICLPEGATTHDALGIGPSGKDDGQ